MQGLPETALANPWGTLRTVLDGPLHPGGREATEALLDRAGVDAGTRVLDVGCGAGESLAVARDRGARAVGLDRDPGDSTAIRGEMTQLPVADDSIEVVLAECVMCLAADRERALGEVARVVDPGGRLALSDVVVEGEIPDLPEPLINALCLQQSRSREETIAGIEAAGFVVDDVREHRDDLLAMQETVQDRVDYEGLLGLMGDRGQRLLDGIHEAEAAVEDGRIGYISLVAERSE
ncbi:methyltransferase domain-containing protein [Halonotius terrestris]|uniref:Methyltransferase domain-containing protein n=1 Tax=Halonotius terrestris TaxID=2487750 RepID=A0A8J8TBV4_9EURY|nr:methyltransferase domain-containing protein [Halonotius terrestris]TQQ79791.1 methyltransferase domain-containing protein [Halonotius terrestris]